MSDKLLKYVEEFNRGEISNLVDIFGDINSVLKFFKIKNLIHLIDPFIGELEDEQLELLDYMINTLDSEEVLEKCVKKLSDIVQKEDGYYLKMGDREDLSVLFDDRGRNLTTAQIATSVLGDDSWHRYDNTTNDVYRDVISELNPSNVELLKKYILDRLTNWKVEVDDDSPDLFKNYVDDEGVFYLESDNVGDVIGDEESMNYLMSEGYLEDLESELYNIHNNAYNNALESEIYDMVMNELETFFDTKSVQWISEPKFYYIAEPKKNYPDQLIEYYYIKFNPNEVKNSIKKYVGDRNLWGSYQYNIDYIGNWFTMMNELMDDGEEPRLDFRIPDYADYSRTSQDINEIFPDYI